MPSADNIPPLSLGLGGDGDEIDAIENVERAFGVRLDYSDARTWLTVGDVFATLKRALSDDERDGDHWARFTAAISEETGVDPSRVTESTLLMGRAHFDWRLALVAACLAVGLAALVIVHGG